MLRLIATYANGLTWINERIQLEQEASDADHWKEIKPMNIKVPCSLGFASSTGEPLNYPDQ